MRLENEGSGSLASSFAGLELAIEVSRMIEREARVGGSQGAGRRWRCCGLRALLAEGGGLEWGSRHNTPSALMRISNSAFPFPARVYGHMFELKVNCRAVAISGRPAR